MRTVFHLSESDPQYGERAFRNVRNLLGDQTIQVSVAVVANGGGVRHLLSSASTDGTVRELLDDGIDVCACSNTIVRSDYTADDLIEGVRVVSSGVGELTRMQADGYAYIRP